jgi:hypothetical protein
MTATAVGVEAPVAAVEAAAAVDTTTQTPEQIAAAEAAKAADATAAPAEVPALEGAGEGDEPALSVEDGGELTAETDADGVVTYAPTGDAGMDMALAFAGNLGLGMDHPAMLATASGDWSLLEAHCASLGDKAKGYERLIALAMEADGRLTEKATARTANINAAISGVLGETQAAVLEWATTTATPDEKRDINAMLRANPVQARAAAMMLADLYAKASGTVVKPASATTGAAAVPSAQSNAKLTNRQFADEVSKLVTEYGASRYQQTTEYVALVQRLGK